MCEDKCTKEIDGKVCGVTDHVTDFSLLLGGGFGGSGCGQSTQFMIGEWEDLVLIGSLLGASGVCLLSSAIIVAIFGRRISGMYRSERIKGIRQLRRSRRFSVELSEGTENVLL